MSKTSDWKIVATEGATVDGRTITAAWIKDMAETYSPEEYTAMIWPEHYRFSGFGKNWGTVEAVKAEKHAGKLRLFARMTPNRYLLEANADAQKLFTSIEPRPNYKGEGRCYLMGLAVTDSPASTGTTRLKFSRDDQNTELNCSHLEEINLDECFTRSERFFAICSNFFSSGEDKPEAPTEPEDTEVTEDQLKAALKESFSAMKTELSQELENKFSLQPQANDPQPEQKPDTNPQPQGVTAEQFSAELEKQLKPFAEKLQGLETQFNALSQEVPGQTPDGSGAETKMEVF